MIDYLKLTIIGLLSGGLGGLVGGGSDAIIVPFLVSFGVFTSYKTAVGTSLATLLPPVGLFAVYKYWKNGNVNIPYSLYLAVMFTIGSYIMSSYGIKVNKKITRKIYGGFLFVLAIIIFMDEKGSFL
tara:strand:- start:2 stop:382 length:381 start_codon:yes stop_codon:yes gene_type:complete